MSRKRAIDAKCKSCIHDPYAKGTWREQVAVCASTNCPLWAYRPTSEGIKTDADRHALAERLSR